MSQTLTSNTLVESIKRRAFIPENQNTFTFDDFLDLADEEIQIGLVPSILALHEDHFMFEEIIPLVANTTRYEIPTRAIGNKLRELAFQDDSGNVFEMTRIHKEDLADYQGTFNENTAYTFYVEGNEIVIIPSIGSSVNGNLVFTYYIRPNKLVAERRIATITNIDTGTGVITLDTIPTTTATSTTPLFSTSTPLDFVKAKSPHSHLAIDKTPTVVNTTAKTITFTTSDIPSRLKIGDHVALACETKIPQVPTDLHMVLAHRVAARCLEALGDTQGLQNANLKLAEMEQKIGNVIDNRVEGAPQKIVNRNGLLRLGLASKRFRRRN